MNGPGAGDGKEPLSSTVVLRVTRGEKARWVKAAQPRPLATWVRTGLNWLATQHELADKLAGKDVSDWRERRE